eukprot:2277269-Rhodomonas_salina.1
MQCPVPTYPTGLRADAGGASGFVRPFAVPTIAPQRLFVPRTVTCAPQRRRLFIVRTVAAYTICLLYTSPSPRDRG